MALTRDALITAVMAETKREDKQTYLETVFPNILYKMSRAITEDGEPLPLQDLKEDGSLSITDGDYYIALPSDFIFQYAEPELLYDTDKGRQLIKKSLDWMDYHYPNRANNTNNKSKPAYYCLEKNQFDFAPMSDDSYTIIFPYQREHPTVDDNDDTILFRNYFRDVIKDILKSELFELLEDWDKVSMYINRAMLNLRTISVMEKRSSKVTLITNYSDI